MLCNVCNTIGVETNVLCQCIKYESKEQYSKTVISSSNTTTSNEITTLALKACSVVNISSHRCIEK